MSVETRLLKIVYLTRTCNNRKLKLSLRIISASVGKDHILHMPILFFAVSSIVGLQELQQKYLVVD